MCFICESEFEINFKNVERQENHYSKLLYYCKSKFKGNFEEHQIPHYFDSPSIYESNLSTHFNLLTIIVLGMLTPKLNKINNKFILEFGLTL